MALARVPCGEASGESKRSGRRKASNADSCEALTQRVLVAACGFGGLATLDVLLVSAVEERDIETGQICDGNSSSSQSSSFGSVSQIRVPPHGLKSGLRPRGATNHRRCQIPRRRMGLEMGSNRLVSTYTVGSRYLHTSCSSTMSSMLSRNTCSEVVCATRQA